MSWLPTFNSRILNLAPSLSIEMASILAAATAVGRFSAGIVLRRFDWPKVLVTGLLLAAALVLVTLPLTASDIERPLVTQWSTAPLEAFLFPLIGFCIAPVYPAINSVILSSLPPRQHGPMAGLIVVFSALGGTSGSLITGNLFDLVGGRTAFYFSLVPITLIIIALMFFKTLSDRAAPDPAVP
jgi:MFS transporter, FHS family, glucose/mannose:H+ symporter